MRHPVRFCGLILSLIFILTTCGGNPNSAIARQCSSGLDQAFGEMNAAKADGLSSSVALAKAGTLLGAAQAQHEIERYAGCVAKVRKARAYLQHARRK